LYNLQLSKKANRLQLAKSASKLHFNNETRILMNW